jgi:hypothetical protein
MHRIATVMSAVVVAGWAPGPAEQPVDRLGWLAGCWEGTLSNGATYEEMWLAPRGGSLLGLARMSRGDVTMSYEFIRIVDDHGTLAYFVQPGGRPPTRFAATHVSDGTVTFENPEHDFPQRILYRRAPPDSLVARIEGERGGQLRALTFPLKRVACPG